MGEGLAERVGGELGEGPVDGGTGVHEVEFRRQRLHLAGRHAPVGQGEGPAGLGPGASRGMAAVGVVRADGAYDGARAARVEKAEGKGEA